jgi:hypothetical protein
MIRPALLALALTTSPALAYLAQNDMRVEGSAQGFEVLASPGMGAPRAWCAAGEYVIRYLALPRTTQIWRMDEPPRPAGQGIRFGLSPEGAATQTGLVQFGETDATLTAGAAEALCWDPDSEDD